MNLPVPTLPTDNLYKFMALSGLAIVIFSFVFPMIRMSEIKLKLVEVETQTELLEIETKDYEFRFNELKSHKQEMEKLTQLL